MPESREAFVAGCYGKLPARGDFVARRLPPAFVEPWDAWLQSAIFTSRELLGPVWLDRYSRAPIWRFLLSPGLLTEVAVAGVLMPSVDRVGRQFPWTIASPFAPVRFDMMRTLFAANPWFASLEAAARAALDPALDLDAYDKRIQAIASPAGTIVPSDSDRSPLQPVERTFAYVSLEPGLPAEALLEQASACLVDAKMPSALWLARNSPVFGDCLLATDGLPQGGLFCAMLDGDWQGHGWSESKRRV